jgi:hypothetical protein
MNTLSLIAKLKDIFTTDSIFLAWCTENIGGQATLYIGVDDANPPGREDYPVIGITEITTKGESTHGQSDFAVEMGFGVASETITDEAEIKCRTYAGKILAESFRSAGLAALKRAALGKMTVEGTGQVDYHPLYVSGMQLTISTINTGRN